MLNENCYYMVLIRHSACKVWSSICIQDIVLHYQINSIRLIWLVFSIRFIWQVNLMKMIIYMFRTERYIKNPVKKEPFANIVIAWKPLTIFAKSSILDNWLGFKYTSRISKVALHKYARKSKHLRKNEKQILQERGCVL